MRDSITVLKHPVNTLAKTWRADGSVKAYDNAKFFQVEQRALNNSRDLSNLLTELEKNPHACVIRGAYVGDAKAAALDTEFQKGKVRRIAELYEDIPHHWMLVEIDNFYPRCRDPVADPVGSIDEFLSDQMPFGFHGADYHWQLSSSAGRPECAGKLKAHVWFWLHKPYTSAQLKAWAAVCAPGLDASVFNTVQIHYTAAPVFEAGVTDPVPVRSGFVKGFLEDSVMLAIDAAILESAKTEGKPSRQHKLMAAAANDPVAVCLAKHGMIRSTGKAGELFIECPFEERHTQASSPTSTVYYPAHTGGYAKGAFVCQHAHCHGVPQSEFLNQIGIYSEQEILEMFDVITDDPSPPAMPAVKKRVVPEALHLVTDAANAGRIAKRHGKQLMWTGNRWLVWNDRYWESDPVGAHALMADLPALIRAEAEQWRLKATDTEDGKAKNEKIAAALDAWSKKSEMGSAIETLERLLKKRLRVPQEQLDTNPWLLNCANGTVDLRTGTLKAHRPEDYITRVVPINFDPKATAPEFITTLARITCEYGESSKPLCAFLQRWFGYCATGEVREQKFAVLYGDGNNGKSTLLDLITGILGRYSGVAAPGLLTGKNGPQHPNAIADLAGRRMVTTHESGEGEVLREDFVKQATGGDTLKARYLYGEFFEFKPTHKLQLLTNHKPVIKGQDSGIWRRIMLIPFKAKFDAAEGEEIGNGKYLRDMRIAEKLATEREGVLAWIVAGAVEWYKNGLRPPDIVLAASEDYKEEQDRVGQFIDEECELGADKEEKLSTPMGGGLYPAYTQWCKASGVCALSKTRFLDGLKRRVPGFKKKLTKETPEGGKRREFVVIQGVALINTDPFQ
ncbi:phage/plasmid primase, P4 family [Xylella fastidiosa]|jgi:putative DNA primase/helicase|uniref:DNA primase family protein n=1 Tax=Xylella fastidiosa TaxID=2371 RepID=UPI0009174AC7|nr:phage/plasmid primase, P4 family [Xylella fastidiosa]QIS25936.1 DNA primase [Xylella fastidiosa]WDF00143.1 phage/plasmid primase, P4 family [Xylella fastidiosa subsp. fastidiosa]WDV83585.1 phage/plasmid primase, P4 family [Xylella fastidiosa]SHH15426.1 putative DNA primase/helicase [Xylella fastidiosa]